MAFSERFVSAPAEFNAERHDDFQPHYLITYLSIRSFASLSSEAHNFCFCFPRVETIAKKYGLTVGAVREAIAWLEANGYIYRLPRGHRSTTYTIVINRDSFVATLNRQGMERAVEENEIWIKKQRMGASRFSRQVI